MLDIRYVCLSDMHLGAETSLLTKVSEGEITGTGIDPTQPSSVLVGLAAILQDLIQQNENHQVKPALILNGDILEMALAEDQKAAMVFNRFLDQMMPMGQELFGKTIYYIPGNHDHHLWEFTRETLYSKYFESKNSNDQLDPPKHATRIFNEQILSSFLTALLGEHANLKNLGFQVQMAYPNFGLLSPDKKKCIVFHHGHFIESMYKLASQLKAWAFPGTPMPDEIQGIEQENFAWIDFFWSALGRSGQAGVAVDRIYEELQDKEQVKKRLSNLISGLDGEAANPLAGAARQPFIDWAASIITDKICGLTRNNTEEILGADAENGLRQYLEKPLLTQIEDECNPFEPSQITFVFGHSHKPFERYDKDTSFAGYPARLKIYNTGGWVIDSNEIQKLHGGAVILIDENYNVISLRLYNETDNPDGYQMNVQEAMDPEDRNYTPSAFLTRIKDLLPPAADFSSIVTKAIGVRRQNLIVRQNIPVLI